jgi:hypothetical protein
MQLAVEQRKLTGIIDDQAGVGAIELAQQANGSTRVSTSAGGKAGSIQGAIRGTEIGSSRATARSCAVCRLHPQFRAGAEPACEQEGGLRGDRP